MCIEPTNAIVQTFQPASDFEVVGDFGFIPDVGHECVACGASVTPVVKHVTTARKAAESPPVRLSREEASSRNKLSVICKVFLGPYSFL